MSLHPTTPVEPLTDPALPRWPTDQARGRPIARVAMPLPREARSVVERAVTVARGGAYRTQDHGDRASMGWYPVVVCPAPTRGRALVWPAVRTAVPAGTSAALLGSIIFLAGSLDSIGLVGTALGSVVSALVARTQYKLEREQHALGSLWLASDYSAVLVGRYDTLGARLTGRARYYLVPLGALCPADDRARLAAPPMIAGLDPPAVVPGGPPDAGMAAAWQRWHARVRRVGYALAVLGVDATAIDGVTAERVYTLARLARFTRFARGT